MQSVNDYDPEGLKAAYISPEKLASLACKYKDKGNIGVAFTYNEPLISFEYILDTAVLLKDMGMKTVLVTNGCIYDDIGDMILPYVDALNIDLKSFKEDTYKNTLKGNLNNVKSFIEKAVKYCHVELTTLVVPGMNSEIEEMEKIAEWIASLKGGAMIPLHISRFFPRYKMSSKTPTDIKLIYELADIARKSLKYVYVGNC
jgi:pyruvate formate lyase activating enzyme